MVAGSCHARDYNWGSALWEGDVQLPWIQTSVMGKDWHEIKGKTHVRLRIYVREPRLVLSSSRWTGKACIAPARAYRPGASIHSWKWEPCLTCLFPIPTISHRDKFRCSDQAGEHTGVLVHIAPTNQGLGSKMGIKKQAGNSVQTQRLEKAAQHL